VIRRTTARGFRQMIAIIGDSGNLPSIRLHERVGFRRAATLHAVGFKFGRWVDSVIMQLGLGTGDTRLPDR
jgi:phosphinothricin acetyltransferase